MNPYLVHEELPINLELEENYITVLTVENPEALSKVAGDLYRQTRGGDGGFILSLADKTLSFSKSVDLIWNPAAVSCSDRRILTGLYKEMIYLSNEMMMEEKAELNKRILSYLDQLAALVPYHVTYEPEFPEQAILKAYEVRVEEEDGTLADRLIDYLRAMHSICGISIFFCFELLRFLTDEERKGVYEFCIYEKLNLVIIESHFAGRNEHERNWIIDKDLCIIKV